MRRTTAKIVGLILMGSVLFESGCWGYVWDATLNATFSALLSSVTSQFFPLNVNVVNA